MLVAGGAGNVGHAAVALAAWGGARVVATVGSPAQAARARAAGAAAVVDRIAAAAGGAGVDRVVEVALGANVALDERVIANGGTIAFGQSPVSGEVGGEHGQSASGSGSRAAVFATPHHGVLTSRFAGTCWLVHRRGVGDDCGVSSNRCR